MAEFAAAFDASAVPAKEALLVYHVDLPAGETIGYRDIRIDPGKIDFAGILRHFVERMRRFCPGAVLYFATGADGRYDALGHDDVRIVRLPADARWPMFERALASAAFMRSRAFCAPTALLDSDAFPNRSLAELWELAFDVALTYRTQPGLMPVNEGVMFARPERPGAARRFFERVLATYNRLLEDEAVRAYYGDVRRWRGGQLALNAVVHGQRPYSPYRRDEVAGARVRYLPCDTFNYSFEYDEDVRNVDFSERTIVHLKGARKGALTILRAAMNAPTEAALRDRRFSLDRETPTDYEPPAPLANPRASLTAIADHYKTDKGNIKNHYTEHYARYLEPLRGQPVRLLEIGVASGASLKMWSRYLGPQASIVGVDVRPECAALCAGYPSISIRILDATQWQPDEWFDVVVDDGSHVSADIVRAFARLWPRLRSGGYYFIEDLGCTHSPTYPQVVAFKKPPEDFAREHFIGWLDEVLRSLDGRASDVELVHFYPQLAVLRKR
ncbi:MAG TPA: class I SAM-dependent methyltransferase [Burkholderiales bacterium]|nr:class I SAM-dependent methyltransferase [Burkholderiales bacterium]